MRRERSARVKFLFVHTWLTAALQLHLRPCLTLVNKKQVKPKLGATTREHFHLKPHYCPLPLALTRQPPKTPLLHQNESSSDARQRYGSAFARA